MLSSGCRGSPRGRAVVRRAPDRCSRTASTVRRTGRPWRMRRRLRPPRPWRAGGGTSRGMRRGARAATESSVMPRASSAATRRAQARLGEALLLPERRRRRRASKRAGDVGAGVQRGDDRVGAALGLGALAERLEVDRSGHEAAGGRVVDHPQAGRREAPAHLDVDRVVEALVVQPVAEEQRPLARDAPLPEPAPVELLAVAEALVREHQPVDVGDVVHERGGLELGRPVGVTEDRDRLAGRGRRGRRGGARGSRARRGRRRRRTGRSAPGRGRRRGSSPRCGPRARCASPTTCELGRRTRRARLARSSPSEPSSTTTTSYSARSRVCFANDARHERSSSGRSYVAISTLIRGGVCGLGPGAGRPDGDRVRRPRSGGRTRRPERRLVERSPQPDGDVVGERHRSVTVDARAHRQHRQGRDVVDLAGDGADVALGDRRAAGRAAGVCGLQPVDVEGGLRGDQRVEEAAREDRVVADVDDVVGVAAVSALGAASASELPALFDREPGARAQLGEQVGRRARCDARRRCRPPAPARPASGRCGRRRPSRPRGRRRRGARPGAPAGTRRSRCSKSSGYR